MGFKITKLQLLQADTPDKNGVRFPRKEIENALSKLGDSGLPVYGLDGVRLVGVATDLELDDAGYVVGLIAVKDSETQDFGMGSACCHRTPGGAVQGISFTHVHAVEPGTLAFDRSE